MSCGVDLSGDQAQGFDPSEAETVIAPVLRPDADKPRAASLGPSGDLPDMGNKPAATAPPTPPPAPAAAPPTPPPAPAAAPPTPPPAPAAAPPTPPPAPAVADASDRPEPTPEPSPAPAQEPDPNYDTFAFPTAGAAAGADDMGPSDYADDDFDEEPKKSKKKLFVFGCIGCLLLACCAGLIAATPTLILPRLGIASLGGPAGDDWADGIENVDISAWESTSWGHIRIQQDTVNVYEANSTDASVAETKGMGDTLEYYGFDESMTFFKVKTAGGSEGFIAVADAEIPIEPIQAG
jgi:hypothetical protein